MKAQNNEPITADDLAIIRAYNAQYMREYRRKNRERLKDQAQRAKLRKAKAAIEAGTLEMPMPAK